MIVKIKYVLFTVLFMASIAIVGKMDYNDDVAEFKQYCVDVTDGVYPDYKNLISKCGDDHE